MKIVGLGKEKVESCLDWRITSDIYWMNILYFLNGISVIFIYFYNLAFIFNSYSSRTRRIWADIYNQRGRSRLVNFQAVQ